MIEAMNTVATDELLDAIAELRGQFPHWRLGQLIANLVTAAGNDRAEAIWDVDDLQLLAAARRLIASNRERTSG
jgi:hypothetical protein